MKTVFKKGQKVYDQMFFPYVEGRIIEIHDKYDKIQIEVKFFSKDRLEPLCMQSSVFYSEKGTMLNFLGHSCKISTLSTKPYQIELQGFEQKEPIPTFEDVWDRKTDVFTSSDYDENYSGYPSQELADAAEALRKLLFLRDYYNGDWKPDLENSDEVKYCIKCYSTILIKDFYINGFKPLYFKSEEIRDKFLEEQKELLEIAKPLL